MNKIIVCPNEIKKKILLKESNSFRNIKFYSKSDYLNHYYFSYDLKTIYYLMKKYHLPYSIAQEYIKSFYWIESHNYKSKKLQFLRELKEEVMNNHLLMETPMFHQYINGKEVDASTLYDLDLFEEKALGITINPKEISLDFPVYECSSMEEEIHFVCCKIRELIDSGVPLSKIYLCNVEEDYYFILDKMFSYYGIPIEIPYQNSIYGTTIVQKYLKTGELDTNSNDPVTKSLCNILGELVELEEDEIKKEIIIEKCKSTMLPHPKYKKAITIKNLKESSFEDDEYVFVLGFNQDSLPRIYKDTDFINDQEKEEVDLYPTTYLNKREKKIIAYLLFNIKNLIVTYKTSSPFQKYYPSSMIDDYQLMVQKVEPSDLEYSDLYNQIRLGEMLDNYYVYGEKHPLLDTLNGYYDLPYQSYEHAFTGIDHDLYLNNLKYPLRLSYTSFNCYKECKFKYYANNVLKLGTYEPTFAALIGSLYHEIISLYKKSNFDLETEWNHYLEEKDLSLKETVLLVRIRKDLEQFLSVLQDQSKYTKYNTEYYEKELKVKVREDISVEFIGYIDKIMTFQNVSDTYFSIVDYKTGSIDTHIEPMKYGLHMQLPIYLYLIHKSNIFESPIFTGIYYQNILFSYPTWSKNIEKEKKENYKLKGYSTDQIDVLERFDSSFRESEIIKSMKYNEKFDRYNKILSNEMLYQMIEYTDHLIHQTTDEILEGDFKINPKVYNKENISCAYCEYHELCFARENDIEYLPKVEDFSFLGGEE